MKDIAAAHPIPRAEAALSAARPGAAKPVHARGIEKPPHMSEADFTAIRDTAREFESMMLSEMLRPMFDGLEAGGPFGGGQAEETWRGMMIQQYGAEIARSGGIGIADQVVRQLLHLQEGTGE